MRASFLIALIMAAPVLPAKAGTPLPDAPHVVAPGEATTRTRPDSARTSLGVTVRDADAGVVKQRADAAVNAYLAALQKSGIRLDDVSASALSISEEFEYETGRRTSRGFRGNRSVDVRVRDLKALDAMIDAGLRAGMNEVGSIRFESTREEALKLEARRQAAADSRKRAEQLASAFGARLGRVYSIDSVGSGVMNRHGADLDQIVVTGARVAPAPVAAPGQYIEPSIDFRERVQVVYEIIP